MSRKTLTIGAAAFLILAAFLAWLFIESSKPLPGQKIADLGRKHIEVGSRVLGAGSDPPTSGDHYADWVRAGVYETSKDDGYLIHSLEHGYIIISYKCSEECHKLVDQLISIYEKKGKKKLIVVPRENLETNFVLTAWTYIDKFDSFDGERIEKFIDAHRDQGPERTVE